MYQLEFFMLCQDMEFRSMYFHPIFNKMFPFEEKESCDPYEPLSKVIATIVINCQL